MRSRARVGHQQQRQRDDIGDEARDHEQEAAREHQRPVDDLAAGRPTLGHGGAEPSPRRAALRAEHPGAERPRHEQQQDRRQRPDRLADLDGDEQLGDGPTDEKDQEEHLFLGYSALRAAFGLGERGGGTLEPDPGEAMEPDDLDERPDLRLGSAEQDRAAVRTQPASEHGEVEHQRRVGEHEVREVDDDVGLRTNRSGECSATASLCGAILVALAAKRRGLVIEVDDSRNLAKSPHHKQARKAVFIH